MARDIEEFLRRAAERRKQQQAGGPPPAQPPRAQPPTPPPARKRPVRIPEKEPGVIELTDLDIRSQSVSEHVQSHINTNEIADHAEHLGDRITAAHDLADRRMQERFSRDLTAMDDRPSVQQDVTPSVSGSRVNPLAEDLVKMMQNPESLRQVILLNEIMRRPNFDD